MKESKKVNMYIGMITKDGKSIDIEKAKEKIAEHMTKGFRISGYNIQKIQGYWKENPEPSLKVSFVDTYGLDVSDYEHIAEVFKREFEQEGVLLEVLPVNYKLV